jgi:hypothetical protein
MHITRFKAHKRINLFVSLLLVIALLIPTIAFAEPNFTSSQFRTKWQRADKPISDGNANPARSWLWGPDSFVYADKNNEPYVESPGGTRQVLYFDKARMEINNPLTGQVTNGLLVRELISGKLATGDSVSVQRRSADDIPIAGDPSGNSGPTYASFGKVASTNNDNPSPVRTGASVVETISRDGAIGVNASLGNLAKYVYYDDTLKHNIPDVFWNFLNQRGNVYTNGQFVDNQPVMGDNPIVPWLDATGFPITDAYWATVIVAGKPLNVLTQAFERRVLTFTPDNPPAFKVEMGNVGRHYFTWRYDPKYDLSAPPPPAPSVANDCSVPDAKSGSVYPSKCVQPGTYTWLTAYGFSANERIGFWLNSPSGQIVGTKKTYNIGSTGSVEGLPFSTKGADQGIWSWVFQGETSGHQSVIYIQVANNVGVKYTSVKGAVRGSNATISAQTTANTQCSIDYWTPAGNKNTAAGLEKKPSDGSGNVSWSWTIGSSTTLGTGSVQVTCDNTGTAYTDIEIKP